MTDREVISIKEYIDTRVAALEQATKLAADTLEKRLDAMNEFREALKNQSTTFVTRSELCTITDSIEKDVRSLRETRAVAEGKASQSSANIAIGLAVIGLVIAIVGLILRL